MAVRIIFDIGGPILSNRLNRCESKFIWNNMYIFRYYNTNLSIRKDSIRCHEGECVWDLFSYSEPFWLHRHTSQLAWISGGCDSLSDWHDYIIELVKGQLKWVRGLYAWCIDNVEKIEPDEVAFVNVEVIIRHEKGKLDWLVSLVEDL